MDDSGTIQQAFLWGPGVDQLLAATDSSGSTAWAISDPHGTIDQWVDSSGNLLAGATLDSFGNPATHSATTPESLDLYFSYTGKYRDPLTGEQYNTARWYDPATGRFLSHDPIEADANSYRYASNDPVNRSDPSGLKDPSTESARWKRSIDGLILSERTGSKWVPEIDSEGNWSLETSDQVKASWGMPPDPSLECHRAGTLEIEEEYRQRRLELAANAERAKDRIAEEEEEWGRARQRMDSVDANYQRDLHMVNMREQIGLGNSVVDLGDYQTKGRWAEFDKSVRENGGAGGVYANQIAGGGGPYATFRTLTPDLVPSTIYAMSVNGQTRRTVHMSQGIGGQEAAGQFAVLFTAGIGFIPRMPKLNLRGAPSAPKPGRLRHIGQYGITRGWPLADDVGRGRLARAWPSPRSCVMPKNIAAQIDKHFATLTDPRRRKVTYPLLNIVTIALCAVLCGADDFVSIARWARMKKDWLAQFLDLSAGIPSHDRFNAILGAIKPAEFEKCLLSWITSLHEITAGQLVAIDGKTLRRSYDKARSKSAIHMVSAWATANHVSLGQVVVDAKSNEITAIPKLLKILELSGCLVTIDAMGCQTEIAAAIVDAGAHYVLAVKDNQPTLHRGIEDYFAQHMEDDFARIKISRHITHEKQHGRETTRQYYTCPIPKDLPDAGRWKNLKAIGMAINETTRGEKSSCEFRYYILAKRLSGKRFGGATRGHWGIENQLHWQLDVTFGEDQSRIRQGHADANFSILRRTALSLLKNNHTEKVGIKNKRLIAGWNEDYLREIVFGK